MPQHAADLSEMRAQQSLFRKSNLNHANLHGASLIGADLRQSQLKFARLIETDLGNADISRSWVYGISAWVFDL
jgi:uncharacterized protein YjbI with pentapeptide repeats